MTDLVHITDHVRAGYLNVNGPFLGKPRIASFIWALITGLQELENAVQSVISLRQVDNAELPQLKILGKIVGQRYGSEDTETYRALVRARIVANRSSGTANDLLRVVQTLNYAFVPQMWFPAASMVALLVDADDAFPIVAAMNLLHDAKAAHEGLYVYHITGPGTYAFWERAGAPSGISGGWGRASDSSVGGRPYRVLVG
jgi:hypothetical protein